MSEKRTEPQRKATRVEEEDHGILRDDGETDRPRPELSPEERARRLDVDVGEEENPVLMPEDDRFPDTPETFNADKGDRPAEERANRETLDMEELGDAYSKNDPGINTKE